MDLTGPFRGSAALAAGAVTRGVLAGARFQRLYPDVYASSGLSVDLELMSRAAVLLAEPDGVLSGYSAAELLGASCGPQSSPAEVTAPRLRQRIPRLLVHRDHLFDDEIVSLAGLRVTSPARTAFDLVRWRGRIEGIVAVDALARRHRFAPDSLRALRSRHLGARGSRKLDAVMALADPRAESPMESRMRLALRDGGLPAPRVQFPVTVQGRRFYLDLAYPKAMLGVEYDGAHHREAEQALRDLEREALLAEAGWKIHRFPAAVVLGRPFRIAARVREELCGRSA